MRHLEGVSAHECSLEYSNDAAAERLPGEPGTGPRFTTYPVVDAGRPIGLLAFSSVAAVPRSEWETRRVRDAMIPLDQVELLAEDTTAVDALTALSSPMSNRGLVVEDGHLAGLLSITDLARALEVRRRPRPAAA